MNSAKDSFATSPKTATGAVHIHSLARASLGLAKAAVGAGALLFPSCYHRLGLLLGVTVTLVAAALTFVTLGFLGEVCHAVQGNDMMLVARRAGSPAWAWFLAVAQVALLFGPLLVYLSLTGEYFHSFLHTMTGLHISPNLLQMLVGLGLVMPLTLGANTKVLNNLGVLGMLGMCYVAALCLFDALFVGSSEASKIVQVASVGTHWRDAARAVPMIVFAFSSHLAFPLLLSDMPNAKFTQHTVLGSVAATCCIYMTIGIFGYSRYGPLVHGKDVLKVGFNDGASPVLYLIGQLMVAVANLVSCPILILSLISIIKWARGKNMDETPTLPTPLTMTRAKLKASDMDIQAASPINQDRTYVILICVLAVIMVPFSGSISALLDWLGAIFGCPVALILPSYFWLRTAQDGKRKPLAYACMLTGLLLLLPILLSSK